MKQMMDINITYANKDFYKIMSDTLRMMVGQQQYGLNAQRNLLNNYEEQLSMYHQITMKSDSVTTGYKNIILKNDNQIKWLKIQRNSLAGALLLAVVTIFVIR